MLIRKSISFNAMALHTNQIHKRRIRFIHTHRVWHGILTLNLLYVCNLECKKRRRNKKKTHRKTREIVFERERRKKKMPLKIMIGFYFTKDNITMLCLGSFTGAKTVKPIAFYVYGKWSEYISRANQHLILLLCFGMAALWIGCINGCVWLNIFTLKL